MTDYRALVRATELAVAQHEAAHCIVAEVSQLPRHPAGIRVTGSSGRCAVAHPPNGDYGPEKVIAAFLAGVTYDHLDGRETMDASTHDLRVARAIADGDDELFSDGLGRAWNITQLHRAAIEHLARSVMRANGRLVGDELSKAIDAAMGAMPAARRRNERMNARAIARRETFEVAWAQREQALIDSWRPNQPAPDMVAERQRTWREADTASLTTTTTTTT